MSRLCIESAIFDEEYFNQIVEGSEEELTFQALIDVIVENQLCPDEAALQTLIDQAWELATRDESGEAEVAPDEETAQEIDASVPPPPPTSKEGSSIDLTLPEDLDSLGGPPKAPAEGWYVDPEELPQFIHDLQDLSDEEMKGAMVSFVACVQTLEGASDLHISAKTRVFLRRNRQIEFLTEDIISPDLSYRMNMALLLPDQKEEFLKIKDLDYALNIEGNQRFRVNVMVQKEGVSANYHLVPAVVPAVEELGLRNPEIIKDLLNNHNGLILITGPVGSGKTTTLASLVQQINHVREDHIITVEDPVEIVQESGQCIISQRQTGEHTESFASALKGALREDPDILVIGELRDLETTEMAITASETGHLVIGTMHTSNAVSTLSRLLDAFPPSQQNQIRAMVAESLRGIICQRLLPAANGGLVMACEILLNISAVSNLIREKKEQGIQNVIEMSSQKGMCLMDDSVMKLWESGQISGQVAKTNLKNKTLIQQLEAAMSSGQGLQQAPKKKKKLF